MRKSWFAPLVIILAVMLFSIALDALTPLFFRFTGISTPPSRHRTQSLRSPVLHDLQGLGGNGCSNGGVLLAQDTKDGAKREFEGGDSEDEAEKEAEDARSETGEVGWDRLWDAPKQG